MAFILTCLFFMITASAKPEFHRLLRTVDLEHYFGVTDSRALPNYTIIYDYSLWDDNHRKQGTAHDKTLEFNAFGELFNLPLNLNSDLVGPSCYVLHLTEEGPLTSHQCNHQYRGCHYRVDTESYKGAFSTCNNLYGYISFEDYNMIIQPILPNHVAILVDSQDRESNNTTPHLVFKQIKRKRHIVEHKSNFGQERKLEVMAVSGPRTTWYHQNGIRGDELIITFMLANLNIVATLFQDDSLTNKMKLTVGPLIFFREPPKGLKLSESAHQTLSNFCSWQRNFSLQNVDVSILITRMGMTLDKDEPTGLAFKGGICRPDARCVLADDTGLSTALTIAHEIGHTFNMSHDNIYPECRGTGNIMQAYGTNGSASFHWSKCSDESMTRFLREGDAECLGYWQQEDVTQHVTPGEVYGREEQCHLAFGSLYTPDHQDNCGLECCVNITCKIDETAMDGTECGHRKWCLKGVCKDIGINGPSPKDGQWSTWGMWTECSRSEGGGIQERHRECNNPKPRYDGKECSGEKTDVRLCNVQPFGVSDTPFRLQQMNARGMNAERYQCRMTNASHSIPFVDGTNCNYRSVDQITKCYQKNCETFGCDGVLNSRAKFDACGVCNGRGNCLHLIKNKIILRNSNYRHFVENFTIPIGATNITIVNRLTSRSILVAKQWDEEGNSVLLTDRFDVVRYLSFTSDYIKFLGPLEFPLHIQIIGYDPSFMLTKFYKYDFHWVRQNVTTDNYVWRSEVSACSARCGNGTMVTSPICMNVTTNKTVDNIHCDISLMPKKNRTTCQRESCNTRWRSSPFKMCSKSCGAGRTERYVLCYEEKGRELYPVPSSDCGHLPRPIDFKECNTHTCPPDWVSDRWSQCSVTCSIGVKTRVVRCVDGYGQNVNKSNCNKNSKPALEKTCCNRPCYITDFGCVDRGNCSESVSKCISNKTWALDQCPRQCGICGCRDINPDCKQYVKNQYCRLFRDWSIEFCAATCGWCHSKDTDMCKQWDTEN